MSPRRSKSSATVVMDETVAAFTYEAKRKNNPPSGLAAQGRIAESRSYKHHYNPHLPPILRSDPSTASDKLPVNAP